MQACKWHGTDRVRFCSYWRSKLLHSSQCSLQLLDQMECFFLSLKHCQVKVICLCLLTSIFPFHWKYAYIQPVPKRGDPCNPSDCRPFQSFWKFLNKVLKRLSTSNLSDYQCGFHKRHFTGNLAFLWSSSLAASVKLLLLP